MAVAWLSPAEPDQLVDKLLELMRTTPDAVRFTQLQALLRYDGFPIINIGGRIMSPDPVLLDELVRRTVEAVQPRRIILFGSAARGTMGPQSDLDVLVVMPNSADCRAVTRDLYRGLRGLNQAKDLLVVRQCDLEQHGANPYMVFHDALAEGKELYHAAP